MVVPLVPSVILFLIEEYISEAEAFVLNEIKTSSVPVSLLTALRYLSTLVFVEELSVTVKPEDSACFLKPSAVTGVRAEQAVKENTAAAARTTAHNLNIFFNVKPPIILKSIKNVESRFYSAKCVGFCMTIRCSKGTYIRTICADIGDRLGSFGVMTSLRRTQAAGFRLCDAVTLDEAKALSAQGTIAQKVLPTESLFLSRPALMVTQAQAQRFQNGGALSLDRTSILPREKEDGLTFRVFSPADEFLGLGAVELAKGELSVLRLFCERQ